MPKCDYDVVTLGNGLGRSALARLIAKKGLRAVAFGETYAEEEL